MLRMMGRTGLARWAVPICWLVALLMTVWLDARMYRLLSQGALERMLRAAGDDYYMKLNASLMVDYDSNEDMLANYLADVDQALESFRQVSGNTAAVMLPQVFLIPLLLGGRFDDGTLHLACQTGTSRRRQYVLLLLWYHGGLALLETASVGIYVLRLWLACGRTLPGRWVLRLIGFRCLCAAAWSSLPLAICTWAQRTAGCTFVVLIVTMVTWLANFGAARTEPWWALAAPLYLMTPALWGADYAAAVGAAADPSLAPKVAAGCVAQVALWGAVGALIYGRVTLRPWRPPGQ